MDYNEIIEKIYRNRNPRDFYRLVRENAIKRTKFLGKYLLKPNKPNFIIIGAQKSGTTSLHYYLNQHPLLVGTRPKELHYFNRWINYGYDINWYERHFNHINPHNKLFFEATPDYISDKPAPKSISKFYPHVKLILVLRNPVYRALSAYNMYSDFFENDFGKMRKIQKYPGVKNHIFDLYFKNRESFPTLMEAFKLEINLAQEKQNERNYILNKGIYVKQLQNYYKHFDTNQILVIGFKDLTKNIDHTLKTIYSFLQVPDYPVSKINIEPRHQRKHKIKLKEDEISFLEDYYAKFNEELFNLLGKELNW